MNSILQDFARSWLRENLTRLPEDHHRNFKTMYGRGWKGETPIHSRSVKEAQALELDAVVDDIPPGRLSWAMEQVVRSLHKISPVREADYEPEA